MRIFSKFKDYYDSALSLFNDSTIVYDRKFEIFENVTDIKEYDSVPWKWYDNSKDHYLPHKERLFHIGFCGKWYHCIVGEKNKSHWDNNALLKCTCLNYEMDYKSFEEISENNSKYWFLKDKTEYHQDSEYWTRDIFLKYNAPILFIEAKTDPRVASSLVQRNWRVEKNISLSYFDFAKIVDPYTAMQELEMFLGNVLTRKDEVVVPTGTDDQIRDSKGFDKWSFRKHKEQK